MATLGIAFPPLRAFYPLQDYIPNVSSTAQNSTVFLMLLNCVAEHSYSIAQYPQCLLAA